MRIALGLEYDGSAFCGWQTQPAACGVQDHLQSALTRFAPIPLSKSPRRRTDTGVHATAQVVHFDTDAIASRSRGSAGRMRAGTGIARRLEP
jgi:tRNA pseudouridine38-40 synthase